MPVSPSFVTLYIGTPKFREEKEQMDVITAVLRSPEAPVLSRGQLSRLARAHKAYMVYSKQKARLEDSEEDEGPQDEDCWLIEDLRVLAHLYSKLKDREQLIELIFEVTYSTVLLFLKKKNPFDHEFMQGFTAELLKDILTIFYSPLAQVYRAANIADSLSDLQNFISDLIKTVGAVEMCKSQIHIFPGPMAEAAVQSTNKIPTRWSRHSLI